MDVAEVIHLSPAPAREHPLRPAPSVGGPLIPSTRGFLRLGDFRERQNFIRLALRTNAGIYLSISAASACPMVMAERWDLRIPQRWASLPDLQRRTLTTCARLTLQMLEVRWKITCAAVAA